MNFKKITSIVIYKNLPLWLDLNPQRKRITYFLSPI
jgi:hypothetical protein